MPRSEGTSTQSASRRKGSDDSQQAKTSATRPMASHSVGSMAAASSNATRVAASVAASVTPRSEPVPRPGLSRHSSALLAKGRSWFSSRATTATQAGGTRGTPAPAATHAPGPLQAGSPRPVIAVPGTRDKDRTHANSGVGEGMFGGASPNGPSCTTRAAGDEHTGSSICGGVVVDVAPIARAVDEPLVRTYSQVLAASPGVSYGVRYHDSASRPVTSSSHDAAVAKAAGMRTRAEAAAGQGDFRQDAIHDAVLSYLESTGRHEVVAAMLRDEGREEAALQQQPPEGHGGVSRQTSGVASLVASPSPRRPRHGGRSSQEMLLRTLERRLRAAGGGAEAGEADVSVDRPTSAREPLEVLCGLRATLRADLALLYDDLPRKFRAQLRPLGATQPPRALLHMLLRQACIPLWSVEADSTARRLPSTANAVTGQVLCGTLNQLVEELTHVYLLDADEVSEVRRRTHQTFVDAFLRQHRLIVPSSVLLAKLIERTQVPASVQLGFEHFTAHGISIHMRHHDAETGDGGRGGCGATAAATPYSLQSYRLRSQCEMRTRVTPGHATASPPLGPHTFTSDSSTMSPSSLAPQGGVEVTCPGRASHAAADKETTTSSTVAVVTHYSPSATLWLRVCSQVQTKVFTTLLLWLQRHPTHFDAAMLHCVLHFVEQCLFCPVRWSDCPAHLAQLGHLLREAVASAFAAIHRPSLSSSALPAAALSPAAWAEWCRLAEDTVPPTLRPRQGAASSVGVLSSVLRLPRFVRTAGADGEEEDGADMMDGAQELSSSWYDGVTYYGALGNARGGGEAAGGGEALRTSAEAAVRAFFALTTEDYVHGLTAAHQRLFCAFPAEDTLVLARHHGPAYLTSAACRRSRIHLFLRTAAEMTRWAVCLLLQAAYVDAQAAASKSDAGALLNSFAEGTMPNLSDLHELYASHGEAPATMDEANDTDTDATSASSSPSSAGSRAVVREMAQSGTAPGQQVSNGSVRVAGRQVAAASLRNGAMEEMLASSFAPNRSPLLTSRTPNAALPGLRTFVSLLNRLLDLVVGFLQVNNVHASYSVYCAMRHPYVVRLLRHDTVAHQLSPKTVHQLRQLRAFYTITCEPDGAARRPRRQPSQPMHRLRHTFRDYLNTVPDNAEYPTIPLLQHYIAELGLMHRLEPTILTSPLSAATSLLVAAAEEPVVLIHWRKLFMVDEVLQRISAFQKACQHYFSSKSTVVRTITTNVKVEEAFGAQLRDAIIRDQATLRTLVDQCLAVL